MGAKRKRSQAKGLLPGERLKREKLAGPDLYSQWGWISRISDPSQITAEHCLDAYGFTDKVDKPICKNKYSETAQTKRTKQKTVTIQEPESKLAAGENADDIIIISSNDEERSVCSAKGCKENPQCINYLGQAKLEQEDTAVQAFLEMSLLGQSPLANAREPDIPIGLKNLGATCYANAFIQERPLGHSTSLSPAYIPHAFLYSEDNIEDSPIFQLQVTFAALQECTQNVFNPIKLVESLHLRAAEQQDAQEFSKLFMSHLATEFEKQAVPSLKTLLTDQFEGKQTYGTMCQRCRQCSERDTNFLELEINLETNNAKLEERVEALLKSERLTDDNQYYCTRCDSLQDAIRYTRLRRLPPKSKQTILFPPVLDMSPFMNTMSPDSGEPDQIPAKRRHTSSEMPAETLSCTYELRGVLLHKGPSAYHGHYEAQVYDVATKRFYQFNDETVTPIATAQFKKGLSTGGKEGGNAKTYARKKRRIDDSDGEVDRVTYDSSYMSSKDAYMLIYARRDTEHPNASQTHTSPEPPRLARERVASLNKLHDTACVSYTESEAKLTAAFKRMRQQKMHIYRHWRIDDFREESAVVSRSALEEWLMKGIQKPRKSNPAADDPSTREYSFRQSSRTPEVVSGSADRSESLPDPLDLLANPVTLLGHRLDNSPILCRHSALNPNKTANMKRIKKASLASIRLETGSFVDPELTTENICRTCITELFIEKRYALDHGNHVHQFDGFCESGNDTQGAWISKPWLKDWRQTRPKMHVPGKEDPAPDDAEYADHVLCPHGQLSLSPSSRKWINGQACAFLQSLFPTWHPMVSRADDLRACPSCDEDVLLSKETKQELKQRVDREKEKLKRVIGSNVLAMDLEIIPGVSQAVISTEFLRQWRAWINRPHEKPRPGAIDNSWLICQHSRLNIDPSIPQDLAACVSLVSLADWTVFQELYGGGPLITLTGNSQESQGSEADPVVSQDFEVCRDCRNDRLRNFETAIISIRILGEGSDLSTEQPEDSNLSLDTSGKLSVNEASENHFSRERRDGRPLRTSSRLRNSRRNVKCKIVTIQKLTTVKDIKIELHEELNIPTICQRLYFKGEELTDNLATMASLGILANDTLDLREEKEDDDALNSDEHESNREPREGRAFGGTILGGIAERKSSSSERGRQPQASPAFVSVPNHCPVCTFINSDDTTICDMCGSKTD